MRTSIVTLLVALTAVALSAGTAGAVSATPPGSEPTGTVTTQTCLPGGPGTPPQTISGPVEVTVAQALVMALGNNKGLVVERMNPQIQKTFEDQQRAVFDPDLTAEVAYNRTKAPGLLTGPGEVSQDVTAQAGLSEFLPTGTLLSLTGATTDFNVPSGTPTKRASGIEASATQHLLRGFGTDVNLVGLRQARIDTRTSEYELRGFAENLAAQVEETYWNYSLAEKQMEIFRQSLALAQQQLEEDQERIRVGKLAPTEAAAAEAEVALRHQDLISGENQLENSELQLLRLLNPSGLNPLDREVVLKDQPLLPNVELESLASHIETAMRMRPDLNQARLQVNRGDLDVVKTKNGLLPQLDLFVTFGRTQYADSFGESVTSGDLRSTTFSAGLSGEIPLFNRAARASYSRATLTREQLLEALGNQQQLAEVDVRTAYITITLAKQQVEASGASRKAQEESLRAETEKFRVGKSTSLLVATAQRDYLQSQIAEVQAIAGYLNAFVELYRLDGSLLVRRGVVCSGAAPVTLAGGSLGPDSPK